MAYEGTTVNWSISQSQIVQMLSKRGIYQTRFTNMEDRFVLEFVVALPDQPKPVAVRIVAPLRYTGEHEDKRKKELNRLHRVLFFHLKAKFVAIDDGLTEMMNEFMAHLIITDDKGNSTTMGERLLPQYTKSLAGGETHEFKLLGK